MPRTRYTKALSSREIRVEWRAVLFWCLLLSAFGPLSSSRTGTEILGLLETVAFLIVAATSIGKLESLGLEFAHWNGISNGEALASLCAGFSAGGIIVVVAAVARQAIGAQAGWNNAVLATTIGPVLEEVVFRGYIFSAALIFTRRLQLTWSLAVSIISVAAVFSLAHISTAGTTPLQLGCIVLTGCLYACIRFRCRSTLAAVLAHAAYNFTLYLSNWCLN